MHLAAIARNLPVALFAALLCGCVTQFTEDVEFVSVEAVDWRDHDEVPGPGSSVLVGIIPDQAIVEMGESVTGGDKPPRLLLKVEFTTRTNVGKFIQQRARRLGSYAYFCDRPDEDVLLASSRLYWRGKRFGRGGPDQIWWQAETAERPITYYFFIMNIALPEEVSTYPDVTYHAFDLFNEPRDICFTLRGGEYLELGYKSNTVVVPASAISAALRDLPPAFR